ncbi:hypothetical protein [Rhizobium leguminosarum]|nr:hypothetical protein [Rhizobium leguminosarum]
MTDAKTFISAALCALRGGRQNMKKRLGAMTIGGQAAAKMSATPR